MHNNNTILTGYRSLFTAHIESIAKFHGTTNDWLSSVIATDLFFEDTINKGQPESPQDKLSTHQKIMATIKEIADNSRQYLNRLTGILGVLNVLVEQVEGGEDNE